MEIIALALANRPPDPAEAAGGSGSGPPSPSGRHLAPAANGVEAQAAEPSHGSPAAVAAAASGGSSERGPPSGGTLVICPGTLLQQWRAELGNHAHGGCTGGFRC